MTKYGSTWSPFGSKIILRNKLVFKMALFVDLKNEISHVLFLRRIVINLLWHVSKNKMLHFSNTYFLEENSSKDWRQAKNITQ